MNWINQNIQLKGTCIDLIPMESDHFDELLELARDKRIWEFFPVNMSSEEKCRNAFLKALEEKEKGTQFPFVIVHKEHNKIIGSTRFLDIQPAHRKLEIGWTWLSPVYWKSEVNLECKLLLLTVCFEHLKAVRVQLKTDENNVRSRKAIAKIGGQYEGILRQDMMRDNGTLRNTAYFSLLNTEWDENKIKLEELFRQKQSLKTNN